MFGEDLVPWSGLDPDLDGADAAGRRVVEGSEESVPVDRPASRNQVLILALPVAVLDVDREQLSGGETGFVGGSEAVRMAVPGVQADAHVIPEAGDHIEDLRDAQYVDEAEASAKGFVELGELRASLAKKAS